MKSKSMKSNTIPKSSDWREIISGGHDTESNNSESELNEAQNCTSKGTWHTLYVFHPSSWQRIIGDCERRSFNWVHRWTNHGHGLCRITNITMNFPILRKGNSKGYLFQRKGCRYHGEGSKEDDDYGVWVLAYRGRRRGGMSWLVLAAFTSCCADRGKHGHVDNKREKMAQKRNKEKAKD